MYSSFQLAKKYLHYYLTAHNGKGHGMHSPFVFDFILHVLNNKSGYKPTAKIEALRQQLLQDKSVLEIEDHGAGSRVSATKKRRVQQIAKAALKPKKYAQLLFRLVKHYQPQTILELGTSLGLTASYMAAANPAARLITIEGSKAIAAAAQKNIASLGVKNIQVVEGSFEERLQPVLDQITGTVDLAYIDGNHRYLPTITYFHQLLAKTNTDSIFVFDDIHWSLEMEQAWEEIKAHPSVQYSIDIFALGFVFFCPAFKVKQHFTIRF